MKKIDDKRFEKLKKQSLDIGTHYISDAVLKWLFKFTPYNWIEDLKVLSDAEKVFEEREGRYVPYNLVRDVYRFLSGRVGKVRVTPENYWVYELVISNPQFRELCQLTEGRDIPAKIVMQMIVAKLVLYGILKRMKSLPSPALQKTEAKNVLGLDSDLPASSEEQRQDPSSGEVETEMMDDTNASAEGSENIHNENEACAGDGTGTHNGSENNDTTYDYKHSHSDNGINSTGTKEVMTFIPFDKDTMEKIDAISTEVSRVCKEMKEFVKKHLASTQGGLFGGVKMTRQAEIIKVDIPRKCLRKINRVVRNVYGEYLTDEWTIVKSPVPDPADPELLEEDLASLKVLEAGFLGRERRARMKLDIYLDVSGSMSDLFHYYARERKEVMKVDIAFSILKALLNLGMKIDKLFLFNTKVWEERLEDAIKYYPTGGTAFLKVAQKIKERRRPSLVISDMEAGEGNITAQDRKWLRFIKPNAYYIGIITSRFPDWIGEYFKCIYKIEAEKED